MRRLLHVLAAVLVGSVVAVSCGCSVAGTPAETGARSAGTAVSGRDSVLARAFADRATDLEVEGQGTVSRLLPEDTDGARHQRFILRLDSGQTLLVSHNVDVAPPVARLRVGDTVSFKGVYEWNAQGGLVHWTHHDPAGAHAPGWIRHGGRTYQ